MNQQEIIQLQKDIQPEIDILIQEIHKNKLINFKQNAFVISLTENINSMLLKDFLKDKSDDYTMECAIELMEHCEKLFRLIRIMAGCLWNSSIQNLCIDVLIMAYKTIEYKVIMTNLIRDENIKYQGKLDDVEFINITINTTTKLKQTIIRRFPIEKQNRLNEVLDNYIININKYK